MKDTDKSFHMDEDVVDLINDIAALGFANPVTKEEIEQNLKNVKEDSGKPQLGLVPIQGMWEAIAKIREYGDKKYPDKDNWKKVDRDRWWNAYLRHTAACANDPQAVDLESGLPHAWHAACNLMFCLELDRLEKITDESSH